MVFRPGNQILGVRESSTGALDSFNNLSDLLDYKPEHPPEP